MCVVCSVLSFVGRGLLVAGCLLLVVVVCRFVVCWMLVVVCCLLFDV